MSVPKKPKLGQDVHYVSAGVATPDIGQCRAAKIVEVMPENVIPADAWTDTRSDTVVLAIFYPTGMHYRRQIRHSEEHKPGTWHREAECGS